MDRGLLLVTVPIACLVLGITYRFFLDPLAKYPGPAIAKLTGFYTMYLAVTGQKTYATYDMHRKYGKVVRIGPNELCFFDLDSIKDIYGQSTQLCTKATAFYGGFTMTGADSVFSTRDRAVHGRMRRLLSYGFSQQGVLQFEQDIRQMVGHYQGIVGSSPQPVDFYALTQHLFLDITSHLSFAKSFDTLTQGSNPGAEDIFTYFNICPLFGEVPIARYLPFGIFRAAKQAQPRIISWAQSRIDEVRAEVRAGTAGHGLLRSMIEAEDSETGQAFSDEELIENAVIFVLAGSATSATTVLYLLWAVAKHPAVEKRLLREVREAFPDPEVLPEYKDASNLVSTILWPDLALFKGSITNPHDSLTSIACCKRPCASGVLRTRSRREYPQAK